MIGKNEIENSLELRRQLLGDGDSPPFVHQVDMIFPSEYFSDSTIMSFWSEYVKDPNHKPVDFYIHIPFCISKCDYCTCPTRMVHGTKMSKYVDNLISFLDSYEEIFRKTVFRNIYIGGGTPSILNDSDFDKLLSYVFNHFKFEDDGGKCCEMNPISASKTKITILKKYHFNRISIGVQSFDPEVLRLNNRGYQSEEMVKSAVSVAKQVEIKFINIDLILGLYGDTKAKLLETFKKALKIKPYSISVYSLQPTEHYLDKHFQSSVEKFDAFWSCLAKDCLDEISIMAKQANLTVPDYSKIYLRQLLPSCWHYHDLKLGNLGKSYIAGFEPDRSVFGVGDKAESKIDGVIKYSRNKSYRDSNNLYFSGRKRSPRIEMIYYLTETLTRENSISLSYFKQQFGKELAEEFKHEIERLSKLGVVTVDKDYLYFTAKEKKDRFVYLLYFFKDEDIKKYIDSSAEKITDQSNDVSKKIEICLKDKTKFAEYLSLLKKIESLKLGKIINGVVIKKKLGHLLISDDNRKRIDISLADNCLFACEYAKENKGVFEEEKTSKEIIIPHSRLAIFMKNGSNNEAILIKKIIPF